MDSFYRVEITSNELGASSVAFTLDLSVKPFRVAEVSVQVGSDGSPLPGELIDVDFGACLSIAIALSRGVFPSPSEAKAVSTASSAKVSGKTQLPVKVPAAAAFDCQTLRPKSEWSEGRCTLRSRG